MKRLAAKVSFIILILIFSLSLALTFVSKKEAMSLCFALSAASLLLLAVNLVILHPPVYKLKEGGLSGLFPFSDNDSDILLLFDRKAIEDKVKAGVFDYSLAWFNLLSREWGYFSLQDFRYRQSAGWLKKRIIIITNSCSAGLGQEDINKLKEFVSAGGVLLLELPDERLSRISGFTPDDGSCQPKKITRFKGRPDFSHALGQMPLFSELKISKVLGPEAEVILEMDGIPAVLENRIGKGMVISLLFDLGKQVTTLRQGYSCLKSARKNQCRKVLEIKDVVTDIIAEQSLRDNPLPFADILEAYISDLCSFSSLAPSWWYYPYLKKSALLLTHDEDYLGGGCLRVNQYEKMRQVKPAFFIMADSRISQKALQELRQDGAELGIHWNPFWLHITSRGFRFNRYGGLTQQLDSLAKRSGGGVFFVNRIHWLKTGKDALQPLRIMAGLGISADSTFGPHSRGKGYVFGAGFPFFLLDTNAGIINLKEFPFQVQDTRGGAGAGYVKALVQDSLAKWHSSIVALYHPHFFKKRSPAWSAWSAALDFAGHPDIWQVNFKEYLSFSAERKRSRLQSDFDWQSLRLSISLEARQVQALRIPAVSGRLRLKGISAQGQPVEARQLHDYALISVPPGKGSYAADYEYSG